MAIEGGLITPVIFKAQDKGLAEISEEMKDLATRARERKLKPQEYMGGTFSISNLGMFGIKSFASIINPPEGMILSVGAGEKRVGRRREGRNVVVRTVMTRHADLRPPRRRRRGRREVAGGVQALCRNAGGDAFVRCVSSRKACSA